MRVRSGVIGLLLCGVMAGCVPDVSPIIVHGLLTPVDPEKATAEETGPCGFDGVAMARGSLDVAAGATYVAVVLVENALAPTGVKSAQGDNLDESAYHRFTTQTLNLSYEVTKGGGFDFLKLKDESVGASLPMEPSSKDNKILTSILGPQAMDQLFNTLGPGDSLELQVTLKFKGKTGSGGVYTSTSFTYPVFIYRSAFSACPGGTKLALSGVCGSPGGQDGLPIQCK